MTSVHSQTLLAFVLALCASLLPASLHAASAAADPDASASGTPATCEQILAQSADASHEADVSEVILHHVMDAPTVGIESPVSHADLSLDFKRLQCRLTGWNGVVSIGGTHIDLTPTKHTFWLWIAGLLLVLLFVFVRPPKKTGSLVPRGLYNLIEMLVLFVRDEIARKNIADPKEADRYTPYLLTAFFFILVMNFLGLMPYGASATSNVSVTLGLALLTFILTQIATIRSTGFVGYFKHLTGGVHWLLWPIMIPVEVLGLFTKPFALTIRLFANLVAGHIVIFSLLGLIFILGSVFVAPVSVLFAGAIYVLEIFVACLQAYIFTVLSALFIGLGVASGHHDHDHEDAH
jgi:F-type H+-transporting ATPase subunit a